MIQRAALILSSFPICLHAPEICLFCLCNLKTPSWHLLTISFCLGSILDCLLLIWFWSGILLCYFMVFQFWMHILLFRPFSYWEDFVISDYFSFCSKMVSWRSLLCSLRDFPFCLVWRPALLFCLFSAILDYYPSCPYNSPFPLWVWVVHLYPNFPCGFSSSNLSASPQDAREFTSTGSSSAHSSLASFASLCWFWVWRTFQETSILYVNSHATSLVEVFVRNFLWHLQNHWNHRLTWPKSSDRLCSTRFIYWFI